MLVFNLRDVHNARTPQPRRFFRTAGTPLNVVIHDDTVYLSDDRHGLFILDPSPFGNFVVRSVVPIFAAAYEIADTRNGTYAYVASGNLIVVDVTGYAESRNKFSLRYTRTRQPASRSITIPSI